MLSFLILEERHNLKPKTTVTIFQKSCVFFSLSHFPAVHHLVLRQSWVVQLLVPQPFPFFVYLRHEVRNGCNLKSHLLHRCQSQWLSHHFRLSFSISTANWAWKPPASRLAAAPGKRLWQDIFGLKSQETNVKLDGIRNKFWLL